MISQSMLIQNRTIDREEFAAALEGKAPPPAHQRSALDDLMDMPWPVELHVIHIYILRYITSCSCGMLYLSDEKEHSVCPCLVWGFHGYDTYDTYGASGCGHQSMKNFLLLSLYGWGHIALYLFTLFIWAYLPSIESKIKSFNLYHDSAILSAQYQHIAGMVSKRAFVSVKLDTGI